MSEYHICLQLRANQMFFMQTQWFCMRVHFSLYVAENTSMEEAGPSGENQNHTFIPTLPLHSSSKTPQKSARKWSRCRGGGKKTAIKTQVAQLNRSPLCLHAISPHPSLILIRLKWRPRAACSYEKERSFCIMKRTSIQMTVRMFTCLNTKGQRPFHPL